jgi:hypothetical protein
MLVILTPGIYVIKLITVVIWEFFKQARVFVPGELFQSNHIFVCKARSLPYCKAPQRKAPSLRVVPELPRRY